MKKGFRFGSFREALDFVNRVGELAEKQAITPTSASAGGGPRSLCWFQGTKQFYYQSSVQNLCGYEWRESRNLRQNVKKDNGTDRGPSLRGTAKLRLTKRRYPFHYPFPPSEVVEHFRTYYGPTNRAFAALDDAGLAALRGDLEQLWTEHNSDTDETTSIESEYLEVVAVRE